MLIFLSAFSSSIGLSMLYSMILLCGASAFQQRLALQQLSQAYRIRRAPFVATTALQRGSYGTPTTWLSIDPYKHSSLMFSTMTTENQNNMTMSFGDKSKDDISESDRTMVQERFLTNQELVMQRVAASRARREARLRSLEQTANRNFQLKELIEKQHHNGESGGATNRASSIDRSLYALKVTVSSELRKQMKLSGREKRGRVFLEADSQAVRSLSTLKGELAGVFRKMPKDSFVLAAGLPVLAPDGSILPTAETAKRGDNHTIGSTTNNGTDSGNTFWDINSDEDVEKTFAAADKFFDENKNSLLKRPSIMILVKRDPNAPPPPPPPAYLDDMADPSETTSMTMLSFYAFPPGEGIVDPEQFATDLRKQWLPFHVLGRVYVAKEGVNAQMSCPTNVLTNFIQCCKSIPELAYMENGVNIDPVTLSMEEYAVAGTPSEGGQPSPPFRRLHIRVRSQVVADGLDKSLDWQSAGYDMPPMEWHETLQKIKQQKQNDNQDKTAVETPVILDCRNSYETDVGIFEGAEPLGTVNFRDSWDVLRERLADTPKDAPIMAYCTGGIRCVKVGAYLTQEMGFTNVSRLAGGIIAYDRTLNEGNPDEDSLFKGTNFVFDGRLGRPITEDSMGTCITCGVETSLMSNCRNSNCHKRMVQCEKCRTKYHGTCSTACRDRVLHGSSMSAPEGSNNVDIDDEATKQGASYASLDEYSAGQSTPPPSLYREMEFNTKALIPTGSHMVSGEMQGRLLKQLAAMTRHGRVLEMGTFTGYATACLFEGVCQLAGSLDASSELGPYVMSMERDVKAFNVAVAHMQVVTHLGFGEEATECICALRSADDNLVPLIEEETVSLVSESGAKCDLIHVSDALATLEEMADGRGDLAPEAPFDLVFVDADKTRLIDYANACLASDSLLRKGGLIVVDNVLWKGAVLEMTASNTHDPMNTEDTGDSDDMKRGEHYHDAAELKRNRRTRKLASKMHQFNTAISNDSRAEVLVLPLRDGLSIIRKK